MHSPFRRRPPRLAGANFVLSPRQRRLAPLSVLLLLISLVLLVLSRRAGRVEVSPSSLSSSRSVSKSAPSSSSSSSSLRLPPAVAAFHARLDDLKLGAFNPGVVAASLREALAGGEGAAASPFDDDDMDVGASDAAGAAASSSSSLADRALVASFSALARDVRAAAGSPLLLLDCVRDDTLPPLASLRLKTEGGGGGGGGGSGGGGGGGSVGGGAQLAELERPRLLLAANLKDSAAVLPHWLLSALGAGARLPPQSFFLSVVESGSADGGATRAWLSLLARLGLLARIRAWVAADAAPPRGTKGAAEDRIRHLAALRNAALSPLWSRGPVAAAAWAARAELDARRRATAAVAEGAGAAAGKTHGGLDLDLLLDLGAERAAAEEDDASPSSTSTSVFSNAFAEANRVAFVNDVFFCPDDVVRLLAHTAVSFVEGEGGERRGGGGGRASGGKASSSSSSSSDASDASSSSSSSSAAAAAPAPVPLPVPAAGPADLACGLDLYRDGRGGPLRGAGIGPWRGVPGEEILPWGERGPPLDEGRGGGDRRKRRRRRRRSVGGGDDHSALSSPSNGEHDSLLLYDVWVSRDANGVPLSARPPFSRHHYSIDRAARGLPFPVSCCWNGLAVFSAGSFASAPGGEGEDAPPPLRFRAAAGNSSESSSSSSESSGGEKSGGGGGGGDCPGSSECSLLCSDLHSRGRWRAVLDPGVRVSYDALTASLLARGGLPARSREGGTGGKAAAAAAVVAPIPSVPLAAWRRVRESPPLDWGFAPSKFHSACCPKGGREDDVVHWEGCFWGEGVRPLERKMAGAGKAP